MAVLVLALYAEGTVDTRFLPPIIQRTSEMILMHCGQSVVDIPEPIIVSKKHNSLDQAILQASREVRGCHVLLIHNDADSRTFERARRERFEPGFALVQQCSEEVCRNLVPVIPIRMTEAWMLVDVDALCGVLGTNLSPQMLELPSRAALVESVTDPKNTLNEVMRKVNAGRSQRRQHISLNTRYELLARRIDLNRLIHVPSYKSFVDDLTSTLAELHFIP
jgi:hypothetical protein